MTTGTYNIDEAIEAVIPRIPPEPKAAIFKTARSGIRVSLTPTEQSYKVAVEIDASIIDQYDAAQLGEFFLILAKRLNGEK